MEQTELKERRYVGVRETLIYGVANGGQVIGYNLVRMQLTFFLVTVFGIPGQAVSLMIFFMGIWDTMNDPIMGTIVDKTRTRYGKLRPYLLFVPIPLGVATILFFGGAEFLRGVESTTAKIVYMCITYFIWEFFYTIGDIPFWGMSAAISPNPKDRSRVITSARLISGAIGGLVGPVISIFIDLQKSGKIGMDMRELFDGVELHLSQDALQELMKKIMNGYKRYLISNGLLNLDKLGFSSYMKTEAFQKLLSESIGDLLEDSGLEEQFADVLQQNMQAVMETYSTQLGEALQTQLTAAVQSQIGPAIQQLAGQLEQKIAQAIQSNIAQLSGQVESALKVDPAAFQNAIQLNMTGSDLTDLIRSTLLSSASSYDSVLSSIGYIDYAKPDCIYIYPNSFDTKALIVDELDAYNAAMRQQGEEDKVILYTDMVGTLMTSVTEIISMVSHLLIAFVGISLVVSSIMIGIITYISVLERRKEIGILRAIGASKHNVSEVFNAETFIIGMCSGVIGVGLCLLLLIPGNMLIHSIAGTTSVTAVLPPKAALVLIVLATLLTILGGLIPARSAAKCNPVTALRSE